MSEIAPPRNLPLGLWKAFQAEMLRVCAEVTAKHSLVADRLAMRAIDLHWNFEFGVLVPIQLPDGSTLAPERMVFEALAEEYGLLPEDFGREFSTGRERFHVAGIDPRRPKYPISATRVPDGKGYKFTVEKIVVLLGAVMKDIHRRSLDMDYLLVHYRWVRSTSCNLLFPRLRRV